MKTEIFSTAVVYFFLGAWAFATTAAAQSSAMLSKAKTEAETKGYIFETNHDAIVAKAKKENPEVGLDYDPIVVGQDFPDKGFAVSSITLKETTGNAVVSSKDKEFKHSIPLSLVKIDGKWLINGIDKLKAK